MTDQELQLPPYYLHQIADELAKEGVDTDDWLARVGLTIDKIDQPDQLISFAQFKTLISEAIGLSMQPAIGLRVGQRLGLTTHGMLGYAIIASSCLRETVELFSRYLNTRTPLIRVELVSTIELLKVELHECYPLAEIRIPFLESAIFTLYNLLMQVTNKKAPIERIEFPYHQPVYIDLYRQSFAQPVRFGCQVASLSLPESQLDKPLLMADQNSLTQAKLICEQELIKLQSEEKLQSRVRKYLLSSENHFPPLKDVAEYFQVSQRTLHRRLQENSSSYSSILRSVREYRADEMLSKKGMTIQEIAFTLGYTDIANFRKAFRKWKGCSPSEYRMKKI